MAGGDQRQFRLALARGDLAAAAAPPLRRLARTRSGRFGVILVTLLTRGVVEAARRHDREDRFLGLFRLFLVGESKQPFGRGENTPTAVERIAASSRNVGTVISSETRCGFLSTLDGVARALGPGAWGPTAQGAEAPR